MKKNKKLTIILSVILAVAVIAGVSAYAASVYGTSSDPLITLSYLNETLTPKLLEQFKAELDSAVNELNAGSSFNVVTLTRDQVLTGGVGCEIMLRVGTAVCSATDSPGLVDTTGGSTLDNGGSLMKNHLYMVTIAGGGIKATADTVKVLVRGSYTVG